MLNIFRKTYHGWLRRRQHLRDLKFLGRPTYIDIRAKFVFHKNISIGQYCRIGQSCHLDGEGGLTIGDGSILASHVVILTSSHVYNDRGMLPYDELDRKKPVVIGKGCWLGWGAMITPGVIVGDGAVVAMGSVVVKDVVKGSVVGGNPAKVINERSDLHEIDHLINNNAYFIKHRIENRLVRKGRQGNVDQFLIR